MQYQSDNGSIQFDLVPQPTSVTLDPAAPPVALPSRDRIVESRAVDDPSGLLATQLADDIQAVTGLRWDVAKDGQAMPPAASTGRGGVGEHVAAAPSAAETSVAVAAATSAGLPTAGLSAFASPRHWRAFITLTLDPAGTRPLASPDCRRAASIAAPATPVPAAGSPDVAESSAATQPTQAVAAQAALPLAPAATPASLAPQSYRLTIAPTGVTIVGADAAGVRNGVQTLRQIIRQCGAALPQLTIEDRPAYAVRGYYLDATRGRVPTLAWLKQWADLLCLYKYNQLQLYIEHTFMFDGLSEAWRGTSPLKPADIVAFDDYCADRGIELVPSVSTFGHHYMALRTRELRRLSEFPEDADRAYSFIERQRHHTLNITEPDSLALSLKLIDDYLQLFRTRKFNICGDETFDLGRGRSHAEAERRGVATMYAEYVSTLCEHLSERGYEPMFWGDIAVEHPEILTMLPANVTLLNWLYAPAIGDDKVRLVAQSGATQYVCPAVWCWNALLPRLDDAWNNISRLARYGVTYGAAGYLVTDWGDYGHVNDPRMAVPGLLYGAQAAWNPLADVRSGACACGRDGACGCCAADACGCDVAGCTCADAAVTSAAEPVAATSQTVPSAAVAAAAQDTVTECGRDVDGIAADAAVTTPGEPADDETFDVGDDLAAADPAAAADAPTAAAPAGAVADSAAPATNPSSSEGDDYTGGTADQSAGAPDGPAAAGIVEMNRRVAAVEYGDRSGDLLAALRDASCRVAFGFDDMVWYCELDEGDGRFNRDAASAVHFSVHGFPGRYAGEWGARLTACEDLAAARRTVMEGLSPHIVRVGEANAALRADALRLSVAAARASRLGSAARDLPAFSTAIDGQRWFNLAGLCLAVREGVMSFTDVDVAAATAGLVDDAVAGLGDAGLGDAVVEPVAVHEHGARPVAGSAFVDGRTLARETARGLERWFETYCDVWRTVSAESELRRIASIVWRIADFLRA
ncbi:beta-N-acetylhexosaminidase [Bifidobacterium leontopitheci]|uniref:beta-N-acetylhexosaminidase n=1 Tax=Bifidobacterium leontopitheci TaxID=2650774 RepID=A0A6I1GL00_9BIFI|nr:glycoside hydrolase family 20 zincin-like fold domain-containing protein [Bifidobacterium leontopitheci]KAB7790139.1 glycoside hydrolase [Bifidobacterium leontopitheci]